MKTFDQFVNEQGGWMGNIASAVGNFANNMMGRGQQQPAAPNQQQQQPQGPPKWTKLDAEFAPGQRDVRITRPNGNGFFQLQLTPQQLQQLNQEFQPPQQGQPQQPQMQPAAPMQQGQPQQPQMQPAAPMQQPR